MANPHFKRILFFLQKRFYNAVSSSTNPNNSTKMVDRITDASYKRKTSIEICNSTSHLSFHIQYLTKACGLSLDSAMSASKKVTLVGKNKFHYDSVVSCFKSHNFSDTHIAQLIEKYPAVLQSRISSNVEPKIQFLIQNGFDGLLLPEFVVSAPLIFVRSLDAQLKPLIALLKDFVSSPEKILVSVRRGSWIVSADCEQLQQNLDYLIEQGVPKNRIADMFVWQPRCMFHVNDRVKYGVEKLKSMGISPSTPMFIHALRVILSLSESTWKRKRKIFESLGWSYDDFISTFIRNPLCLCCSEEKLRQSMDYFVNTIKIDKQSVIGHPKILMFSIEKRIEPRYRFWKILGERNLKRPAFIWMLDRPENGFIKHYVTKYSDTDPDLLQIYQKFKEKTISPEGEEDCI
ncbi:transcription termination factor MTERF6, chloroplastic/mitochondrial-like [Amaranthus tricolor]|uniref:transcription termination factor MTERF6, chloroplastic/mitochondrial-like n=1 Tax=Amaranthus tricolor TaxID=29722 RepID=UPI00258D7F44|nr:transcription termination factor MTERF6, chloroplastic/mitochondrial-like [Amaranthus tricolor]